MLEFGRIGLALAIFDKYKLAWNCTVENVGPKGYGGCSVTVCGEFELLILN